MKLEKTIASLTLLFGLCCFFSLNDHSRARTNTFRSEISGDKAGYYVYLPAFFIYNFNASAFPDSIYDKHLEGFQVDHNANKFITKYTCGTALLESPFFLAIHAYAKIKNLPANGFSDSYRTVMDIASSFYLTMGLWFLFCFLLYYFDRLVAFITCATIFLGTHLFYYSIHEVGMSHIYSFFLFAAFLLTYKKGLVKNEFSKTRILLLGILSRLIFLVRPMNIVFCCLAFMLDLQVSKIAFLERIKMIFKPLNIVILVISFLVIISPQLLYWHYVSGNSLYYSYANESFSSWKFPKLVNIWFYPNNGLFIYTPVIALVLGTSIYMIRKKIKNGVLVLVSFLAVSYIYASWWSTSLGCGFSHRAFVEYLVVFSIPQGYALQWGLQTKKSWRKVLLFSFLFICIVYNIKMFSSWESCWFYKDTDWHGFSIELFKHAK